MSAEMVSVVAPVLRRDENGHFLKGFTGNAGGRRSKWQRLVARAVAKQETPDRVCKLIDAMWTAATEERDPAAANAYGNLVGVSKLMAGSDLIPPELFEDAPDEVLVWIRRKRGG